MPSTNGHDAKRVILYARVSSDEQAKKGYSIGGQLDEIREYAEGQGWEVVGTETDPGYSRETLWRPGLDRVRKTVAAGSVDMVLAWKRDRFGASPVPQLLADEFAEHGARLRSLDDSGEGYDAEFMDGIKDLMAKRELREIARRSRMGRLAKARKGEVVASHKAAYGFRFNDTKDGYELDRERMALVGRIFRELAVEGKTLYAVRKGLQAAGIPTPTGKTIWPPIYPPKSRRERRLQAAHLRGGEGLDLAGGRGDAELR